MGPVIFRTSPRASERATGQPKTDDDDRVLAGRIETLIRQQPVALAVNLINSGLLVLVLKDVSPWPWLMAWVIAVWLWTGLRGALWWRYQGRPASPAEARTAARLMTLVSLGSGLVWGLPAVVVFPADPIAVQGFIVFVLGGMSAGAVATLASHLPAFVGFVAPTLLPMVGRLLIEGSLVYVAMGIMGTVFFLALMATGLTLNRTLTNALRLQVEKSDLAESLTEARVQAESASIAKSAFLATLSHELRTPLNAVLGFAQLLGREVHGPLGDKRYHDYVRHTDASAAHLLNLINELLDLSGADLGHLAIREEPVDLADLLRTCQRLMAKRIAQRKLDFEMRLAEPLPRLQADGQRLRQVFINVLSNAVKFTPEGGRVALTAGRDGAGDLVVVVTDNGIGMSSEELAMALEFFGRADSSHARATEGAGIGLPLTGLLMQLHGGEMTVDSDPGQGTRVALRFPPQRVIEDSNGGRADPVRDAAGDVNASPAA